MNILLGYFLLVLANVLGISVLLWFLLAMDTYGNGLFIPDFIHSSPMELAAWRIVLLQLETIIWLGVMYCLNRGFTTHLVSDRRSKTAALFGAIAEYLFVTATTMFYFYNVLTGVV